MIYWRSLMPARFLAFFHAWFVHHLVVVEKGPPGISRHATSAS